MPITIRGKRSYLSALGLLISISGLVREASACSGPACRNGEVFPSSGTVPRNVLGFTYLPGKNWDPDSEMPEEALRVFVDGPDAGGELALETAETSSDELRVTLTQQPAPGTVLRIEHTDSCRLRTSVMELTVGPDVELTQDLGALEVVQSTHTVTLEDGSAGCVGQYAANYADFTVELSEAAAPLAPALRFSLLVDGEPYAAGDVDVNEDDELLGRTLAGGWQGPGVERLFTLCGEAPDFPSDDGLAAGIYEVQMVGELPDGTQLKSESVTVQLGCEPCPEADCDGGGAVADDGAVDDPVDADDVSDDTPADAQDVSDDLGDDPDASDDLGDDPDASDDLGDDSDVSDDTTADDESTADVSDDDSGEPQDDDSGEPQDDDSGETAAPQSTSGADDDSGCSLSPVAAGSANPWNTSWLVALMLTGSALWRRRR